MRAEAVAQRQQAQHAPDRRQGLALDHPVARAERQHALARGGALLCQLADAARVGLAQHEGRRAEHERRLRRLPEGDRRELALRGEGQEGRRLRRHGRDARRQGAEGRPAHVGRAEEARCGLPHLRLVRLQGNHGLQLHLAGGQGAGLVQAEDVRPGEGLDAVQLLHEGVAAAQAHHAHGQGNARQEHQPLGNHADHGGGRLGHGGVEAVAAHAVLLPEQQQTDRHDDHAEDADQPGHLLHQLGLGAADDLGRAGETAQVALLAHALQLRGERAGGHKAAGHQPVAGLLGDRVALAGQQGFVHRADAAHADGVRRHPVARAQTHEVALHGLLGHQLDLAAPADHVQRAAGGELQAMDCAVRADLLHRADHRVADDHAHEEHIAPRADPGQRRGNEDVEQVEEGQRVVREDAQNGFARLLLHGVALARLAQARGLRVGEAFAARGGEVLRRAGGDGEFFGGVPPVFGGIAGECAHRPRLLCGFLPGGSGVLFIFLVALRFLCSETVP